MKITKEQIIERLRKDNKLVERAMIVLYQQGQTEDERETRRTRYRNGVGFNSAHAPIGSYCAKYCLAGNRLTGVWLEKARKIAIHYAGQLVKMAEEKENGRK